MVFHHGKISSFHQVTELRYLNGGDSLHLTTDGQIIPTHQFVRHREVVDCLNQCIQIEIVYCKVMFLIQTLVAAAFYPVYISISLMTYVRQPKECT